MRTRKLGELEMSEIGLGCMGMSFAYDPGEREQNEPASIKTIQAALDSGITLLDTADMYGPWHNEKLVGKALKGRRDQVVLATKFGNEVDDNGQGTGRVNGRPEYVKKTCEGSLRRLDVDYIDLYYLHRVDPDTPIEETVGAMAELVKEGKVRYLGLSEAAPETIRRAHKIYPITALQSEYSLWTREPEDEILDTIRELGIGFVAYSPLGRGFLTGSIQSPDDFAADDWRRNNPRFMGENFQKNLELVNRVQQIADEKGCTPGQLALAWVLAQGDDIVPIPGTKHEQYLRENLGATDIALSQDELARINQAAPKGAAAGQRYPDMSTVNR